MVIQYEKINGFSIPCVFVCVCMCVCVCMHACMCVFTQRPLITSGMIWCDIDVCDCSTVITQLLSLKWIGGTLVT